MSPNCFSWNQTEFCFQFLAKTIACKLIGFETSIKKTSSLDPRILEFTEYQTTQYSTIFWNKSENPEYFRIFNYNFWKFINILDISRIFKEISEKSRICKSFYSKTWIFKKTQEYFSKFWPAPKKIVSEQQRNSW